MYEAYLNQITWRRPLGTGKSDSRHESDSEHRLRRQRRRRRRMLRGSERKVLFVEKRSIIEGAGILDDAIVPSYNIT